MKGREGKGRVGGEEGRCLQQSVMTMTMHQVHNRGA